MNEKCGMCGSENVFGLNATGEAFCLTCVVTAWDPQLAYARGKTDGIAQERARVVQAIRSMSRGLEDFGNYDERVLVTRLRNLATMLELGKHEEPDTRGDDHG